MSPSHPVIRILDAMDDFGFSLIVISIVYFIVGSLMGVFNVDMLDWTFCGTMHRLLGVDWCGAEATTSNVAFDHFTHRLMNVTLPWFMIFWGFVLLGLSALGLKIIGYKGPPTGDGEG